MFLGFHISVLAFYVNSIVSSPIPYLPYLAISFSFFLLYFTERLSRFELENDITQNISSLIKNNRDLKFVGTIDDGLILVSEYCTSAISVQNTIYRPGTNEIGYAINHNIRIQNVGMDSIIKKGGTWTDIYLEDDKDSAAKFYKSILEFHQNSGNYKLFIAPVGKLPALQCILFAYPDQKRRILFGWHYSGGLNGFVWQTDNADICAYFELYLREIKKASQEFRGAELV